MYNRKSILRFFVGLITVLLVINIVSQINLTSSVLAAQGSVTISVDDPQKSLRQQVALQGMVKNASGQPAKNALVALQVLDSRNDPDHTIMYRTLSVGNPPGWELEVTSISVTDDHDNPINVVKVATGVTFQKQMNASFHATIRNLGGNDNINALVIITLLDSSNTPIRIQKQTVPVPKGGTTATLVLKDLPGWTTSGVASVICDAYSYEPSLGGIPYAAEKVSHFLLSRYEQGTAQYQVPNQPAPPLQDGEFFTSFRLPPDSRPGNYIVYASARLSQVQLTPTQTTLFNVDLAQYPPEASFMFYPSNPYRNMTVQFDASFSYAEGPNNTIVRYAWNWGDGKQDVTTDPLINHKFTGAPSRFLVVLNVTDNNGLWATESKYVYIKSPNPTASFTYPSTAFANTTATFDASSSNPGWDESKGTYSTISQYKWNFGDGTGDFITTNAAINHNFTHVGNYSVMLTVTSSAGLSNSTSKTIRIIKGSGLIGDITGPSGVPDGKVDIMDLALVSRCYGSYAGQPPPTKWDPRADITGLTYLVPDGKVDIMDLALVSRHYGEHL